MNMQLLDIQKQKEKAFKVLLDTQKKLQKLADQAVAYINQNQDEINKKQIEIDDLHKVNAELYQHMDQTHKSISETEKIINPGSN